MVKKCSKCDAEDQKETYNCDNCKKILCRRCSELSETEIRCISLKKRRLTFFCKDCENGVMCIPDILKQLELLQKEVLELKEALKTKTENNMEIKQNGDYEDMISEMIDRQRRASNIMVANIKEPLGNSQDERSETDKKSIKDILKNINIDTTDIKVYRIGKFNPGKDRLVKVVLNSSNEALTVLKNKRNIHIPSIRIFSDQTKQQRDFYRSIKKQLDDLKASGDDTKTIKYINNKPVIVTNHSNNLN